MRRELSVIDESEKDGSSVKAREEREEQGANADAAPGEAGTQQKEQPSEAGHTANEEVPEVGAGAEQAEAEVDEVEGDQTPRLPTEGESNTNPLEVTPEVSGDLVTEESEASQIPVAA